MLSEDPVEVLRAFQQWESIGNPLRSMWYPRCDPTRRIPGRSIGPMLDDEGIYVSRCLARLKNEDPLAYEILHLKYGEGKTLRQISSWSHMPSRTIVDQRHLRALDFLKGMLAARKLLT